MDIQLVAQPTPGLPGILYFCISRYPDFEKEHYHYELLVSIERVVPPEVVHNDNVVDYQDVDRDDLQ